MAAELAEKGALVPFAHLAIHRATKAENRYLDAGLPPTDAREQAAAEHLLQEPEVDDDSQCRLDATLTPILVAVAPR